MSYLWVNFHPTVSVASRSAQIWGIHTMQKTIFAAALAATIGMGSAQAADLRTTGSLKDAPEYVPASTWTGFYLGAGGGIGATSSDLKGQATISGLTGSAEANGIGGMGGFGTVQVGYDRQLDQHFIVGAFFDYDFASIDSKLSAGLSYKGQPLIGGSASFQPDQLLDRRRPHRLSRQFQHPRVWFGGLY